MEYIIIYLFIFLFGIAIGSFLNVCIYRIPRHEDIVSERSHCMACGNVLKWYELVPLFSFLIQGGRCRHCKCRLSIQYPLIELANGLLYLWIVIVRGLSLDSVLFCLCGSVLIVISMIDMRTYEIPPGCNLCILALGIIRVFSDFSHWQVYAIGFFCVSGFFYLLYLLTKGQGIGGGDIKLMAAAGLLLGWTKIILAMIIGCVAGSVIHLSLMKILKKDSVLAFGPYLAVGIAAAMLYGEKMIGWYMGILGS